MERVAQGVNSTTTIPVDLIVEILSLLPSKSIIRFQTVSKQWFSIIRSKDLVDTFLTRSKARPHVIFLINTLTPGKHLFFSVPKHNTNEETSTAIFRHDMTHSSGVYYYLNSLPLNGFVCFTGIVSSTSVCDSITVCNPITRQTVKLPDVRNNGRKVDTLLGYDPVEDEYKVLCVMMYERCSSEPMEHYVCTVSSSQKQEWRKIENTTVDNYPCVCEGICIDGAIYYEVGQSNIVRFDVRSEKMELIKAPEELDISKTCYYTLVNYNGRFGGVEFDYLKPEIRLWVLEDVVKQEWSRKTFEYPCDCKRLGFELMVLQPFKKAKPFCVDYYDFNKESSTKVEMQGMDTDEHPGIVCYPGYVENIRFL